MKGTPVGFDANDVADAVASFELGDRLKIFPFKDGNKTHLNYYILSFPPDVDAKQFIGPHRFFHTTVTIDKYNNITIPQCYKCSQLGHYQNLCGLDKCCHKCGGNHAQPEQCPVTDSTPLDQRYCTLCMQHGHAASYKGCPVYKDEVNRIRDFRARKANKTKANNREFSRLATSDLSYAQAASFGNFGNGTTGNVPVSASNQGTSFNDATSFLDEACLESFGCPYSVFLKSFKSFKSAYLGAKDGEAKRSLVFNFFMRFI